MQPAHEAEQLPQVVPYRRMSVIGGCSGPHGYVPRGPKANMGR